jgi:hypothetical protein
LNDANLEKAFISLFDNFLKLNIYVQHNYKSDKTLKKQLQKIALTFEDLAEHYYWEEINRVKVDDGDTETH